MSSGGPTLSDLLRRSTIENHNEVLKACNTALEESKGDLDAQFVKTIALIKKDCYDDALRVLVDNGDELRAKASLEHAYILYKLGHQEEARKLVHGLSSNRGAKHLEAQASYRCEDFSYAAKLYEELGQEKASLDYESNDLRINAYATDAQLEWKRQGDQVQSKYASNQKFEAFETAYNAACESIAKGELCHAELLLRRAIDLCNLSEDLSEEERVTELLPIKIQQIYVFALLGKIKLAGALSQETSSEKISDLSTRHIAQTNIIAGSSKSDNPHLAHRLLENLAAPEQNDVLFRFQKALIFYNQMALELQMLKFNGVANKATRVLEADPLRVPTAQANISAANAAAHAQNRLGKLGIQAILPLLEKRPNDLGLVVTIIHLYVLTKNHGSAIKVLESFMKLLTESTAALSQDVRHAPGLIALLVSLCVVQGRKSKVKAELVRATSYWRHKSKSFPALLHAAGLSLLASSTTEDIRKARQLFQDLYTQNKQNLVALAGIVASSAIANPEEITELAKRLTPIARLTLGVDVDHLEYAGIPRVTSDRKTSTDKTQMTDELPILSKKRVRKSRLPKAIDPSKRPDPERWLPLRDRSTYRLKGKKGKQRVATLTQGFQVEKVHDGPFIPSSDPGGKSTNSVLGGALKVGKKKRPRK